MKYSIYAPNEQQIEGLKSVLATVPFEVFLLSLERLVAAKFMSKSRKHLLIKRARHILGISYQDYLTKYKPHVPYCPPIEEKPKARGLWDI
jgi:hypothetical protein